MQSSARAVRRLWEAVEPIHAVVYFAPEPADAAKALGLRGWWMGYFAGRFAPLGPIGPEPVAAMAYGFAPDMVSRSLPDAWRYASPEVVVADRIAVAARVLRARLTDQLVEGADELAELLWDAVAGLTYEARPLGAAWSAVVRPDDPLEALWLATTILREHRGDGHVLASVAAGLSGLDNTVSFVATGAVARERIQPHRGWTDGEWEASADHLRNLGFLAADGGLTAAGVALRARIEDLTDELAAVVLSRLGDARVARAVELAAPMSRHLVDTEVVPVPNPIGAPRP